MSAGEVEGVPHAIAVAPEGTRTACTKMRLTCFCRGATFHVPISFDRSGNTVYKRAHEPVDSDHQWTRYQPRRGNRSIRGGGAGAARDHCSDRRPRLTGAG